MSKVFITDYVNYTIAIDFDGVIHDYSKGYHELQSQRDVAGNFISADSCKHDVYTSKKIRI